MEPVEYNRLREIFDLLANLPAGSRAAELDKLFAKDDPARREVEAWLAALQHVAKEDATRTQNTVTQGSEATTRSMLGPGQLIANRYRLTRLLGTGGFAQAFLANDELLHNKPVVAKIPLKDAVESGEWFERHFTDEIRALAALNHPGIVQVLDSGRDPEHGQFFVEQFIEGPTLNQLLKHGSLGIERSGKMLEKIAQALAAAHAKGIVHRDLKPHNILVRMEGTQEEAPVLIDFGIASLLGPDGGGDMATRVAGTPDYLAPEQALGRVLPQSDVYALGCIAIEMLTGERLNRQVTRTSAGETPAQTAGSLLEKLAGTLPPGTREALVKLVSMNPEERGTAAEHAAGIFQRLATGPKKTTSRRNWIGAAVAWLLVSFAYRWIDPFGKKAPKETLRLSLKAMRSNKRGVEAISPRDGVVTRDDKLQLEIALSPRAFCYVFAESLASSGASELLLLYPPRPLEQGQAALMVPSTANNWIEFDNKPEILRIVYLAGLSGIPEAEAAVKSAQEGAVADRGVRERLEARIGKNATGAGQAGAGGEWVVVSHTAVLCIEGRLQHLAV